MFPVQSIVLSVITNRLLLFLGAVIILLVPVYGRASAHLVAQRAPDLPMVGLGLSGTAEVSLSPP